MCLCQIKRLMPAKQHRGKDRPFAGHKNKEARNKALTDARTVGIHFILYNSSLRVDVEFNIKYL